ncbi:MAG: hypothetical protein FWE14_09290 [Lachnospiraceae bacterium]|nr:hypothetical protein [Lachnospiraceae bacterium]
MESKNKFNNGDTVAFNGNEYIITHVWLTTRHEDDDIKKPEYICNEEYGLSGMTIPVNGNELTLIARAAEPKILETTFAPE